LLREVRQVRVIDSEIKAARHFGDRSFTRRKPAGLGDPNMKRGGGGEVDGVMCRVGRNALNAL